MTQVVLERKSSAASAVKLKCTGLLARNPGA
jgi:hypothetical protein